MEGNTSLTTTIGYNSAFQVTSVSGANSNDTATTEYDTAGRPSSSTTADGYDPVPANRHSTTYAYTATTQTATLGTRWKRTTIDGFGRVSKVEAGHETTTESVVETEYAPCGCSPLGKVKRVSQPHAPGAAAKWTVYTYDGLGRTLTVTAPDGSVTTYAYAGASVTVVDAAGKWKRSYTDALGNLVRVEEPNPAGGANYQTTYTYTTLNQLSVVTMPRSVGSNTVTQTRTFTYTGAQVESATNPENGMVQYTYNDARQVVRRVDAKGQVTTYEYDTAGRLTTVRHYPVQWQEDTGQRVSYTYDTQSLVPGYTENGTGRVAAVEFMAGGISGKAMRYVYKYNAAGRVTGRKMQVDRGSGYWYDIDVGYTWDNEGRVTALAHPDGSNYSYTFDAMGRLSGMSGGGTASATYGVAGQLTGLSYLGVTETRAYNDVLQMTRLTAASGGSNVVDMEYVYAAGRNNGRITQAWDHVSGEQVNYTYDSLNRLATAVTADNTNVAQWGLQFSYDGFGNLNGNTVIKGSAPTGAVAVEAATNRVIGETYDANGNPVGVWQGVAARVFDVENRMVFDNDNGIRYGYDDKGKRVLRGSEVYVWGVDGKRLATYQQGAFNQDCQCVSYGWVASNVYFGGKLVKTAGTVVVTDRLGSVRWKGNGETYHYHPYGQQYPGDNTASKVDGKEKFGTYFRDADGKDYADQRYLSQGAGRFLTPDPGPYDLRNPGSWNRYSYAQGDPINLSDPEGRLPRCVDGGWYTGVDASSPCGSGQVEVDLPVLPGPGGGKTSLSAIDRVDATGYWLVSQGLIQAYTGSDDGSSFSYSLSGDMVESLMDAGVLVLGPGGSASVGGVSVTLGGTIGTIGSTVTGLSATAVVLTVAGVAAAGAIAYLLYREGQRWRSEAASLRTAESEYEDMCGHKFPDDKKSQRHAAIQAAKNNSDGRMVSQDELLQIMLKLAPCEDDK